MRYNQLNMKEKEIVIEGLITPESVIDLCNQIENSELEEGDKLRITIDSEGGFVDSGMILANCIEGIQKAGVICESVAGGKVWSAAMLPYLACNIRKMGTAGSFLIHKVMIPIEEDTALTSPDLNEMQDAIWRDSDMINDYYRKRGVDDSACNHLYVGDDLLIANELEAYASGIITATNLVSSSLNMRWNNFRVNRNTVRKKMVCKATPVIMNFKSINEMNEKRLEERFEEIENRLNEKIDDLSEKVLNALKGRKNEEEDDVKPEPMNAEPLTEEELKQLGKHMTKTEVKVESQPDIKWLAHPGRDVEKDHFVIPITKDGKAVMLPEGDYETEIDGESFMIHSTGVDTYLHGRGTENMEVEEGKEKVVKVENEEKEKELEIKERSKAPVNRRPAPKVVNAGKAYWELALKYGKGCVGVKSVKK